VFLENSSYNNKVYFNNFIDNIEDQAVDIPGANSWDYGYPAGGNYWSDYAGVDNFSGVNQDDPGSDGIGDTPYEIPPAGAQDTYPLMQPWGGPLEPRPIHNLNSGKSFSSIQAAIDNRFTRSGHTITVNPGTYTENVIVNKRLTLKSVSGHPADTIITAANPNGNVVKITASYVNFNGFTVNGASGSFKAGIYLDSVNYCNISENTASNNNFGIYLIFSSNNKVMNNNANLNVYGIYTPYSGTNTLSGNNASNNKYGIALGESSNNMLTDNTVHWNTLNGIMVTNTNNSILINNSAAYNYRGIYLYRSNNNTLAYNILSHNTGQYKRYGLELSSSSKNVIYLNNFIDNTDNVYSENSNNIWSSNAPITYTYAGFNYKNYLGNYWDDYTGSDADSDGIGETPYFINSDKDNYPLMVPWENYFAQFPRYDINEDGITNYLDAAYIGIHYGEVTTEPYPRYDINEDGVVNYLDAAYIGIHYGEVTR
jgi:parallel beta-helix repeat protein